MQKHKSHKKENNLLVWVILSLGAGALLLFFVSISKNLPLANQNNNASIVMTDQLQIQDLIVGTGAEARAGNTVSVNYIGTLENGTKFDSSYDRNQPFSFTLGQGQVIRGWEQGIPGMKVGGKRKLIIPPTMGYGDQTVGPIPANSTLIFEVELLEVK